MIRDTYKLILTAKKLYPIQQFFKDRYFPDGRSFYSQHALIETKKQGRKVAPFVIPVVGNIAPHVACGMYDDDEDAGSSTDASQDDIDDIIGSMYDD